MLKYILLFYFLIPTLAYGYFVSEARKKACQSDYYKHCSHTTKPSEVASCFKDNWKYISSNCKNTH